MSRRFRADGELAGVRVVAPKPPLPLSALPTEEGEEWRYLPWRDDYAVSSHGRVCRTLGVRRYPAGRLLTPTRTRSRAQVRLAGGETHGVAQLVAACFLPPPADLTMRVRHGDNDRYNDRADNLRWAMPGEIMEELYDAGRKTRGAGEAHPSHLLTAAAVVDIRARRMYGSAPALAAEYGVSVHTIYDVWQGEAWHDVPTANSP